MQLQKAGLVETAAGVGGSHLSRSADKISLLDIYKAINEGEEEREVFNFHPNPNNKCPVGKNIHKVLDPVLADAQKAMEKEMKKTCLADLIKGIEV